MAEVFYRKLPKFRYLMPKSIDEVLMLLKEHPGRARLLAGGTDLIPQLKNREMDAPEYVIDLKGVPGLHTVTYEAQSGLRIGPLTTISAVAQSPIIMREFPCLAQAASSMASPQVRNKGTIAGNICNAVPSADSAPALIALGAAAKIKGPGGERVVPMDQFFAGPRKTVLRMDEMLIEIIVPKPLAGSRGVYLKLSPRHSMDLAIVGVAAVGLSEEGVCKDVRIALGAVAPTPVRAPQAEDMLKGQRITAELISEVARHAVTQCSPIDDHRASQEYRCDMIHALTKRALTRIFIQQEEKR